MSDNRQVKVAAGYEQSPQSLLPGERLLVCKQCGSYVSDHHITQHDEWHRRLWRLLHGVQ